MVQAQLDGASAFSSGQLGLIDKLQFNTNNKVSIKDEDIKILDDIE